MINDLDVVLKEKKRMRYCMRFALSMNRFRFMRRNTGKTHADEDASAGHHALSACA